MHLLKYANNASNRDVISLFSGAMGLDLGLLQSGLNIKIGQDIDSACVKTMKSNGHEVLDGDIRSIQPEQLLELTHLSQGEPFIICGGPPCQPFSTAGKRLGINDPRGSLFMDFTRIIKYIQPRFFIMENVKGLMSSTVNGVTSNTKEPRNALQVSLFSDNDEHIDSFVLEIILSEIDKLGYKTIYGLLDAVNYGVPQFRERFVLIGSRDNEDIFLPIPTNFQTHQEMNYRWVILREAIYDLESNPGDYAIFSPERLMYLQMIPAGGNWRDLSSEHIQKAMGGAYNSGGGKVGFYRRLSYDEPSPTLVTSPIQKASMLCHPTQDRPLSIREYARIQQFPDEWIFSGNITSIYRQIGNAVPIGLAKALGKAIIATAEGTSMIQTKRTRGTNIHNKIKNAIEMGRYNAN